MTISVTFLTVAVSAALLITLIAPFALVVMWIKDWMKQRLW